MHLEYLIQSYDLSIHLLMMCFVEQFLMLKKSNLSLLHVPVVVVEMVLALHVLFKKSLPTC